LQVLGKMGRGRNGFLNATPHEKQKIEKGKERGATLGRGKSI